MGWSDGQRERERLEGVYRAMGDAELLALHGDLAELTEAGQEALLGEIRRRGVEVPEADAETDDGAGFGEEEAGWRTLHVFEQAFEAQAAFRILEREGIGFALEDRAVDENGDPVPGPAIQMALLVETVDWDRCVGLLRREAGLFPVEVFGEAGDGAGAEEWVTIGEFETLLDVAAAERVLGDAGVGYRLVRHDGEAWERTSVEVRGRDQDCGLEALATMLGEEEGDEDE